MYRLSASKLNVFKECPACFYRAEKLKIARIRGIFPSLPGGMDLVLKSYFDVYRERGELPPILAAVSEFADMILVEQGLITPWRNWRSGLTAKGERATIIGALDDCLIHNPTGLHSPVDYKTRGSAPKTDGSEYYQLQLDIYDLLLYSNKYATSGKAYLTYVWLEQVAEVLPANNTVLSVYCQFGIQTFTLQTSRDRAIKTINDACDVLDAPKPPQHSHDCEYCNFAIKAGLQS